MKKNRTSRSAQIDIDSTSMERNDHNPKIISLLSDPENVLVEGNIIRRITTEQTPLENYAKPRVIDGSGRVLMPGVIAAHWHAFMAAASMMTLMSAQPSYVHLLAAHQAEATLMRGFTTVCDLGGPVFGLKRAIDEGIAIGPRIYPSGAFISQTSGHAEFLTHVGFWDQTTTTGSIRRLDRYFDGTPESQPVS